MTGNLVTDMLELREVRQLKGKYAEGIELHRWIDRYTDKDPDVIRFNQLLSPKQGKYAPVVSDILFDFLISHNWYRISNEAFDDFCKTAYNYLSSAKDPLPKAVSIRLERMLEHNWLQKQANWEGLLFTLGKMDERTKFPSSFHKAGDQLLNNFQQYNQLFMRFLRNIKTDIKNWQD